MKPVFGYLRVSGVNQIDGDGFDRQRATIEEYCARKGFQVIRWFQDGGVSGTTDASDRPGYCEMLSLLGPETTTVIVIERADRLARALTVSEIAIKEALDEGATIYEAASDTDLTNTDDPTRVLIRQFLGALSEWNKSVLVKRMRDARKRKRERVGRCEGRHGFENRSEHDAETLALIMGFSREGWTYGEIAKEMTERSRRTPHDGRHWHKGTVFKIVRREQHKERVKNNPQAPKILETLPI